MTAVDFRFGELALITLIEAQRLQDIFVFSVVFLDRVQGMNFLRALILEGNL